MSLTRRPFSGYNICKRNIEWRYFKMKKTSYARLRRILAMIAALTILLSCLAACGKKPVETEPSQESTPPTAATTEATQPTETTAPPETTPPTVWGTVNTNNLNIRTSPSSTSTILGQFDAGTRVEILEQQTTDGVNWGRLEQGWVNLLFVNLDGDKSDVKVEDEKTDSNKEETKTEKPTTEVTGTATIGCRDTMHITQAHSVKFCSSVLHLVCIHLVCNNNHRLL